MGWEMIADIIRAILAKYQLAARRDDLLVELHVTCSMDCHAASAFVFLDLNTMGKHLKVKGLSLVTKCTKVSRL